MLSPPPQSSRPTAYAPPTIRDVYERREPRLLGMARRHALGIAIAVILAGCLVGPRWLLLTTDPSSGVRAQLSPWGAGPFGYDQSLYIPNVRQAYDEGVQWQALYGASHRNTPSQTGAFWLQGIGALGRITGGIFSSLAIVVTLAALAAFMLLYALAYQLTRSRWGAIVTLLITLFLAYLAVSSEGILALRRWSVLAPIVTLDPHLSFHPWARFLAPAVALPSLYACMITVPIVAERRERRWIALAGVSLAVLVYSYFFYWTAMALALAVWCGWLAWRRELAAVRRLLMAGGLAVLLSLPEFVSLAHGVFTFGADTRARLGVGVSGPLDQYSISSLVQRLFIGAPFLVALLAGPSRNRLFIALYIVPLVLSRAAIGVPQPDHYARDVWPLFAIPAIVAGSAEIYGWLSTDWQRRVMLTATALACASGVWFVAFQVRATRDVDAAYSMRPAEQAAFDWIDANVRSGETVVSPSISTNLYLAALTPASRYIYEGFVAAPTDAEIIDRYLRVEAAYGYSAEDAFGRLDPVDTCKPGQAAGCDDNAPKFPFRTEIDDLAEREAAFEGSMAYYLLNWEITEPHRISDRTPQWRSNYGQLQTEASVLSAYDADYLYCGPRERLWPHATPAPATYARVAFQNDDVTIYRLVAADDREGVEFSGC